MEQILIKIDLTFADYLLMSIILILLHLINVIELSGYKYNNEDFERSSNLKAQATIAFIGIITTLLCGLIAQYLTNTWFDTALITFPLIFIFIWFINQPKSSKFINLNDIHDKIHIVIQHEIASYAERKGEAFTIEDLHREYNTIVTIDILIRKFTSYFPEKMRLPVTGLEKIFKPLEFTEDDIKRILQSLCSSGDLIENSGKYVFKKYALIEKGNLLQTDD